MTVMCCHKGVGLFLLSTLVLPAYANEQCKEKREI